jgi:hypothetical protein
MHDSTTPGSFSNTPANGQAFAKPQRILAIGSRKGDKLPCRKPYRPADS